MRLLFVFVISITVMFFGIAAERLVDKGCYKIEGVVGDHNAKSTALEYRGGEIEIFSKDAKALPFGTRVTIVGIYKDKKIMTRRDNEIIMVRYVAVENLGATRLSDSDKSCKELRKAFSINE